MLTRQGRTLFGSAGSFSGVLKNQTGNVVKGGFRNRFVGGLDEIFGGYANGHLAPSSFVLPTIGGSLSSYTEAEMTLSTGPLDLTPALPMDAAGSLILSGTATLAQIVQLLASGTLSLSGAADLSTIAFAFMDAAGNMTLSGTGTLGLLVEVSASGSMVLSGSALLGARINITASGTMTLTPSVALGGKAFMEASGGGPTPLSPEGLAEAVWNSIAADFNSPGTMGEKLNDSGSASNPWTEVIESGYSAAELLRLLVAVAAGKTDIIDLGGGLATVKFRDIADTKDRITASMTNSERTTVTRDLT
jgi:hypothetical protein